MPLLPPSPPKWRHWIRNKIILIFIGVVKTTHWSILSNALGSSSGIWIGLPFFDQGSRSIASNTGYWRSTSICAGNLQHLGSPTKNITSQPTSLLYKFFHLKRKDYIILSAIIRGALYGGIIPPAGCVLYIYNKQIIIIRLCMYVSSKQIWIKSFSNSYTCKVKY